jgi:hypothetical protein
MWTTDETWFIISEYSKAPPTRMIAANPIGENIMEGSTMADAVMSKCPVHNVNAEISLRTSIQENSLPGKMPFQTKKVTATFARDCHLF